MPKIVISYRRADTEAVTGRIRDRLVGHYGDDSIFMDIDSIPFGIDFRDYIKDALSQTDAVLAIMGTRWTGAMPSGPARIMEETDPVRIEVETALQRGIPVIPVLIDQAVMPQPSELPENLKNLAFRNAAYVDSGRDFHLHMDRLIRSMDRVLAGPGPVAPAAEAGQGTPMAGSPPRTEMGGPAAFTRPPPSSGGYTPTQMGRPAQAPTQMPPPMPPPMMQGAPPPKRSWVKWVAIAAAIPVVLFIALMVIGLIVGPSKKDAPQVAQTPTSAPAPAPTPPAAQPAPPVAPPVAPPLAPPVTPPAAPQPASAPPPKCTGNATVAFQDNFGPPALGWDDPSQSRFFADGEMVLKFADPGLITWLHRPTRLKAGSVCSIVKAPMQANKLDGAASAGVVFWAADYNNYYVAQIYLDGTYQVYRRLSNEWIRVVSRIKSDHVKAGLGAVNELQVTIKDNVGTFYANGEKLVEFRGQPPKNGGAVGLHGESEADRGGEWRFAGITVIDEEQAAPKQLSAKATRAANMPFACKADANTAFADDFKRPDAGWGEMTATASYENGMMVIKPAANRTRTLLYLSLRYSSATMCANVKWPTNALDPNDIASGGVAFWASNYSNFYEASLYRDGTYDVYRLVDDEWITIVKRTPSGAIKKGPEDTNQLKVQMAGNKGTLYINDQKIVEFWGQPPARGGAVGLFAQSDKERSSDWRFQDIAVVD